MTSSNGARVGIHRSTQATTPMATPNSAIHTGSTGSAPPRPSHSLSPVNKAVFPAGGLGTRMLPATKALPKEMLNVVDKPVIQYGIEEAVDSGLDHIILITASKKTVMEDHFDVTHELDRLLEKKGDATMLQEMQRISHLAHISYVRQKQALGLGHAVLVTKQMVGREPFAVFLPDDIMYSPGDPVMAQLLRVHRQYGCSVVSVERAPRQDIPKYGILAVREIGPRLYQVTDMVEKPRIEDAPSDLAIMGRYVLTPEIYDMLEETPPGAGGEIQLTDGLRRLLQHQPVYAYEYTGRRYDCGSKLGFLRATVELALERPEFAETLPDVLRRALDAAGARATSPEPAAPQPATTH
jgi:UTP--glucose-1-phosphate uridylyltransferase